MFVSSGILGAPSPSRAVGPRPPRPASGAVHLPYAALMPGLPWLVLPTFNEAENLERMIATAAAVLAACSPDGHRILVVDDGSPDGTGAIADRLAAEREHVEVLHRTEREGLGPAYLAGFAHALAAGAGYVFE